ncbi:MAG: hypothetical protein PVG92_05200 [Holophagae bacterium]|jgi:hypothetical protein
MLERSQLYRCVAIILVTLLPGVMSAETVSVPAGTRVFLELDQEVISKKTRNRPGSYVQAHVWSDVVVDGHTVVAAGTPALVQIGRIKGAKVAGIKGKVELKALSVPAADGTHLILRGGYDQIGRSRMALSIALAVVIFAPLIFIPGKNARLWPGTVFDASVANGVAVTVEPAESRRASDERSGPVEVEISHAELDAAAGSKKKVKEIPLRISLQGDRIRSAHITRVNEKRINPIPIAVGHATQDDTGLLVADASVQLKPLSKHLKTGYNWLTFDVSGITTTVLLDVEL